MNATVVYIWMSAWLCITASQPTYAEAKWWNDYWELRVPIVVKASEGALSKRPVTIKWASISKKLGAIPVRLSSLHLIADGKSVPFQVDHRDSFGNYLTQGNMTLDPDDEIVFVTLSSKKTIYHLYMSRKPIPLPQFQTNIQALALRNTQAHQRLSSAGLSIDIQGDAPLDTASVPQAVYGKGAIVGMSWQGKPITGQNNNWSVVMNGHPFTADPGNRWQTTKLIVDGPVRKIVAARCDGISLTNSDTSVIFKGSVSRYFSMFSDSPLYDLDDVIECKTAQGNSVISYADRLILGQRPNVNDTLWYGSTGAPRRFPLSDSKIPHTKDGCFDTTGELIKLDNAQKGWYAWFDEKERIGLGVFYGTDQATANQPTKVSFASGWAMWSSENWMAFYYTGLKAPTHLRHRFRVFGIRNATPDGVDREFRLWKNPQVTIEIGGIRRKK